MPVCVNVLAGVLWPIHIMAAVCLACVLCPLSSVICRHIETRQQQQQDHHNQDQGASTPTARRVPQGNQAGMLNVASRQPPHRKAHRKVPSTDALHHQHDSHRRTLQQRRRQRRRRQRCLPESAGSARPRSPFGVA